MSFLTKYRSWFQQVCFVVLLLAATSACYAQDPNHPGGPPVEGDMMPPSPGPVLILFAVTSHGQPAAGVHIEAHAVSLSLPGKEPSPLPVATCVTDASGGCPLTLPQGEYTISARRHHKHVSKMQPINSDSRTVLLELYPTPQPKP